MHRRYRVSPVGVWSNESPGVRPIRIKRENPLARNARAGGMSPKWVARKEERRKKKH